VRVLFCGLGSIGCRHLRNLRSVLAERGAEARFEALRATSRALPGDVEEALSASYTDISSVRDSYDAVFITNPTSLHRETFARLKGRSPAFFIEKPVFERPYGEESDAFVHVACPMRFHPVLGAVRERLPGLSVHAARAVCSSYLPDWRPGTDYRKNYSAIRSQGGGVVLDLIHEWDYLTWLFGFPETSTLSAGKFSDLEIDSDDLALYLARYGDMLLSVHLDYFGRVSERSLTLYAEGDVIIADLLGYTLTGRLSGRTETFEKADLHRREAEYFAGQLLDPSRNAGINTLEHAQKVLALALGEENTQ